MKGPRHQLNKQGGKLLSCSDNNFCHSDNYLLFFSSLTFFSQILGTTWPPAATRVPSRSKRQNPGKEVGDVIEFSDRLLTATLMVGGRWPRPKDKREGRVGWWSRLRLCSYYTGQLILGLPVIVSNGGLGQHTSRSHTSNVVLALLTERVWCTSSSPHSWIFTFVSVGPSPVGVWIFSGETQCKWKKKQTTINKSALFTLSQKIAPW